MTPPTGKCVVFDGLDFDYEFETLALSRERKDEIFKRINPKYGVLFYFVNQLGNGAVYELTPNRAFNLYSKENPPPKQIIAWLNLMEYPHRYV